MVDSSTQSPATWWTEIATRIGLGNATSYSRYPATSYNIGCDKRASAPLRPDMKLRGGVRDTGWTGTLEIPYGVW